MTLKEIFNAIINTPIDIQKVSDGLYSVMNTTMYILVGFVIIIILLCVGAYVWGRWISS